MRNAQRSRYFVWTIIIAQEGLDLNDNKPTASRLHESKRKGIDLGGLRRSNVSRKHSIYLDQIVENILMREI